MLVAMAFYHFSKHFNMEPISLHICLMFYYNVEKKVFFTEMINVEKTDSTQKLAMCFSELRGPAVVSYPATAP